MYPRGRLTRRIHKGFAQGLGVVEGSAAHVIGEYEALRDACG